MQQSHQSSDQHQVHNGYTTHTLSSYRIQRSSVHFDHDVVRVVQLGVWLLAHLQYSGSPISISNTTPHNKSRVSLTLQVSFKLTACFAPKGLHQ